VYISQQNGYTSISDFPDSDMVLLIVKLLLIRKITVNKIGKYIKDIRFSSQISNTWHYHIINACYMFVA
jgi:hypothetical protein